jgi:hypothetical protein
MSNKSQANKKAFRKQAPVLTPEEQAKFLAEKQAAELAAKQETERVELYGKNVGLMSHRQLRSELVKTVKREYAGRPLEPTPGLTIAFASVLLTVLDSTQTVVGKYTRKDQINPFGVLASFPRTGKKWQDKAVSV